MLRASPQFFFPLALAFTAVHYFALQFHMYWYIESFDIVMHVWGGFLIVCALYMFNNVSQGNIRFTGWSISIVVLIGMLAWEGLEYTLGLTGNQPDFILDTTIDLLCGSLGAALGYLILKN